MEFFFKLVHDIFTTSKILVTSFWQFVFINCEFDKIIPIYCHIYAWLFNLVLRCLVGAIHTRSILILNYLSTDTQTETQSKTYFRKFCFSLITMLILYWFTYANIRLLDLIGFITSHDFLRIFLFSLFLALAKESNPAITLPHF